MAREVDARKNGQDALIMSPNQLRRTVFFTCSPRLSSGFAGRLDSLFAGLVGEGSSARQGPERLTANATPNSVDITDFPGIKI